MNTVDRNIDSMTKREVIGLLDELGILDVRDEPPTNEPYCSRFQFVWFDDGSPDLYVKVLR